MAHSPDELSQGCMIYRLETGILYYSCVDSMDRFNSELDRQSLALCVLNNAGFRSII